MADIESLGLSAAQNTALRAAGFSDAASVRGASDSQLLGVAGIGQATVQQIRSGEATGPGTAAAEPVAADAAGKVPGVTYPEPPAAAALSDSAALVRDARALDAA